jgi:hypothetical protein
MKKGKLHSAALEMKRFSDAILPVSLWTSFRLLGGCILRNALTF